MDIVAYIIAALIVDALVGDPRWFLHPVRLIGRSALSLEPSSREHVPHPRAAGILVTVLIVLGTGVVSALILGVAFVIHPWLGHGLSVYLIYTSIAGKDLTKHSGRVFTLLTKGDLPAARDAVAMMVGRDTDHLDERETARAAVESVAENTVDGVTAPLFYAVLAGPVGAVLYRAVNTLDSTFGYKNEQYRDFGWASARLDDLANWIPARLTAPFVAFAAFVLGLKARNSWNVMVRDRLKHASPNSGYTEAAVAGALGVQLGGRNYYFGEPSNKPLIGEPLTDLVSHHILDTNRLMWLTVIAFTAFLLLLRLAAIYCGMA